MESYHTKGQWQRVSKANPCPVCGKPDACKVSGDGAVVMCLRIRQGAFKESKGWHFHRIGEQAHRQAPGSTHYVGKAHRTYPSAEAAMEAAGASVDGGKLSKVYAYHNRDGQEVMRVGRFDLADGNKQFRPVSLANAGWRIGDPKGKLPLYRLDELPADGTVFVCEGEKATDAARGIGLAATTSAHGSSAADRTDWTPLAGRAVVILPDNDEPGRKYAQAVARILAELHEPARIRIVELPGLPQAGDAVEYIAARPGQAPEMIRAEVEALAAQTQEQATDDLIGGPVLLCMADVEAKAISWLWPGRVALGRITLLVGKPGEGKSFLTTDMTARVTTGTPWPDGCDCPPGSVILVSAEDDPGDTIRPRLDAHRADCRKVHLLSAVRWFDEKAKPQERMFTLADLPAMESALKAYPDCRLIVIDPIGSFLGGATDAHRDNEVRAVLAPVARLAEKYGAAVLVVAHRRKGGGNSADETALGSRAFTGIARAVWHLSRDTENKARRLLLPGKNNIAPEGDGLAFTIQGEPAAIVWEREPVTMSADDALAQENGNGGGDGGRPGPEPEALNAAKEWLGKLLADGEVEAAKVKAETTAAGLAWRTVQRAADALGVIREKNAFNAGWQWRFPKPGGEDANRRCQAPQEQENLASWHLGQNQGESGESVCQDTEDAKPSNLGVLGGEGDGRERGEL